MAPVNNAIREEYGVVDLHISTSVSKNSSALKVACPPPGIGAKKFQEISQDGFEATEYLH